MDKRWIIGGIIAAVLILLILLYVDAVVNDNMDPRKSIKDTLFDGSLTISSNFTYYANFEASGPSAIEIELKVDNDSVDPKYVDLYVMGEGDYNKYVNGDPTAAYDFEHESIIRDKFTVPLKRGSGVYYIVVRNRNIGDVKVDLKIVNDYVAS